MALFSECMPECDQKTLDTADIARDRLFKTIEALRIIGALSGVAHSSGLGLRGAVSAHLFSVVGVKCEYTLLQSTLSRARSHAYWAVESLKLVVTGSVPQIRSSSCASETWVNALQFHPAGPVNEIAIQHQLEAALREYPEKYGDG